MKNIKPKNKQSIPAKKVKRIKKAVKKIKVVRTRGSGTLTEAGFWSRINSALRKDSRWWVPAQEVKKKAKRPYVGPDKRQKFEYLCNICKKYYPEKEIQIDHIIPVGSLKCAEDLAEVVKRLYCEEDGYQVICSTCHNIKTKDDIEAIKESIKLKKDGQDKSIPKK